MTILIHAINDKIIQYPTTLDALRRDYPNVSFPVSPTAADLAPLDRHIVERTPPPAHDPRTERLEEQSPELTESGWRQRWAIRPATEQEIADYDLAHAPEPDWGQFKSALLTSPEANAALAAALPHAPGAVLTLPSALMAASGGNWVDFRAAWLVLRRADLIPEPLLDNITALAAACNLPAAFSASLGGALPPVDPSPKPAGWNPPPDPSRGDTYEAPDGSWWRWDQRRNDSGQYVADDPATPEVESALDWLPFTP